jgi:molybdopterin-guanine dinucleotide biosynthesis protein B
MIAVNIVGYKKSGKTTLAVALARALGARGLTVAGAKFSHHPLDKTGTDTARLAEVCQAVAGLGPEETALLWPRRRYLTDLLPLLAADVLVIEGGKSLGWLPRILVLRAPEEAAELSPELALASFGDVAAPGLPHFTEVAALAELVAARGFALPGLDCATCGRPDCRELTREIVTGAADPTACQARGGGLSVTVNGAPMGLNPFVSRVMAGSIRGMLAELKGYAPGEIVITLEP